MVVLEAAHLVAQGHVKVDQSSLTAQTVDQAVMVVGMVALGDALAVRAALATVMVAAKGLVNAVVEMAVQMPVYLAALMVVQTAQELVWQLARKIALILAKELALEK